MREWPVHSGQGRSGLQESTAIVQTIRTKLVADHDWMACRRFAAYIRRLLSTAFIHLWSDMRGSAKKPLHNQALSTSPLSSLAHERS
jgi:hypothetical protein